jgi:uncharacterized phosphosugar-binding protein
VTTASTLYLRAARQVLEHLEQTQLSNVEAAADLVIQALNHGGTVNCSEVGHGIQWDFMNRAGGLFAVQPFSFSISVNNPVPECRKAKPLPEAGERDLEQIRFAVRQAGLRAGDVMIVSSVSGRNRGPVELALACREQGVRTIGLTSLAYTAKVKSLHPSGKRLFEVCDVVIDNGAPYGDAAVQVPGIEHKAVPVSGLGMLVSGWMIWSRVMEKMAAAGNAPSVYISHNREGGPAFNEAMKAQYQKRGY